MGGRTTSRREEDVPALSGNVVARPSKSHVGITLFACNTTFRKGACCSLERPRRKRKPPFPSGTRQVSSFPRFHRFLRLGVAPHLVVLLRTQQRHWNPRACMYVSELWRCLNLCFLWCFGHWTRTFQLQGNIFVADDADGLYIVAWMLFSCQRFTL